MAGIVRVRDTSSSSNGDTDDERPYKCHVLSKRNIPTTTAKWELWDIESLGLIYENHATTLSIFISNLKETPIIKKNCFNDLPTIIQKLLGKTREVFQFSFDFEDPLGDGVIKKKSEVQEMIMELQTAKNDMKKEFYGQMGPEQLKPKDDYLLTAWCLNLTEFWQYFVTLLGRWRRTFQKEMRFTYLFMAFSKIFFLQPEGGDSYSECLHIKNRVIHSRPGVRFITSPDEGDEERKVFVVTEVGQNNALKGNYTAESFSFQNINDKVLGQHGIELLLERQGSFFYPGMAGVICIGTKIIFTYLEMSMPHFDEICGGEIDKITCQSSISYTRPFDYMDSNDRSEILEAFFWFGFVQSEKYKYYDAGD